jgi:hypothetical protein
MARDDERDVVMANSKRERRQFGEREHPRRKFLTLLAALGMTTALACGSLRAQDPRRQLLGKRVNWRKIAIALIDDCAGGFECNRLVTSTVESESFGILSESLRLRP